MKKISTFFLSFIILLALAAVIPIVARPKVLEPPALIPRHVLFGNPERTNPLLSPDGSSIAFLAADDHDVLNVWVAPAHDLSKAEVVTSDRKRGVRSYFWKCDGSAILYLQDVDGDEDWHLFQTELETKITRDLTAFSGVRADVLAYEPSKPDQMLITLNLRNPQLFDIHRLDLNTGALVLDTVNPGDVHEWVADHNLQVRCAAAYSSDGGIVTRVRDDIDSPWRELMRWGPDESVGGPVAFSHNNDSLYILTSQHSDTVRLISVNIASGARQELAQDSSYDLSSVLAHPTTHQLLAVGVERDRFGWILLDDSIRDDFAALEKIAGPAFQIVSRSDNDNCWIIAARSSDRPTTFYLYDRPEKHVEKLFSTLPALHDYTLVPMEPISFHARDGLKIEGYLTLPAGKEAENLPTIIDIHGGPWVRDTWGFSPAIQWLANRGYAVLQINYRGSSGYGKAFVNAGNKEWGAKMHDDILDAKRWLVERGVANPDKIALFGGSYGGYATLVGLAFTPEEFCCGIDVVGVSNLLTLLQSLPPYWEPSRAFFNQRVGDLALEEEMLRERSPLFKADQINKPLLIAQGARDPRVKKQESDQIVAAMRERNKPVEYLVFEDEGHGFARPDNKRRFYAAAEHFLAEHLGGTAQPPNPDEEWHFLRN